MIELRNSSSTLVVLGDSERSWVMPKRIIIAWVFIFFCVLWFLYPVLLGSIDLDVVILVFSEAGLGA